MIDVACHACRKKLRVKDDLAGKKVKCPGCGALVAIPALAETRSPHPRGNESLPAAPVDISDSPTQPPRSQSDPTIDAGPGAAPSAFNPTSFLAPPELPDEIGRLGGYRVLHVLGQGGMGMVFQAEDAALKRKIALKTMLPALAAHKSAKERFLREAQSAAAIEHEHIITIFQVSEDRGVPFLAMPLLKGRPLDVELRGRKSTGPMPVDDAVRIAREIAEGLAAAHENGLIHRDIKPGNVWLEGERRKVKILDFGLARAAKDLAHLTQSGAIVGTPAYMAPEQARRENVDGRADLFSLGCILYEMLTGRRAFTGHDTMSILTSLALDTPTPPAEVNTNIPRDVSDITMRLLEKNPDDRFASAADAAEALRNVGVAEAVTEKAPNKAKRRGLTKPASPRARRGLRLAGGLAGLIVVGGLSLFLFRGAGSEQPRPPGPPRKKDLTGLELVRHVRMRFEALNPNFRGELKPVLNGDRVIELDFLSDGVKDLSPLALLPDLVALRIGGTFGVPSQLTDLNPIKELALDQLNISHTAVSDLNPIKKMPLRKLSFMGTRVEDFSVIKGMTLDYLNCGVCKLKSLEPIRGMKLTDLRCHDTQVDLELARGMPLENLQCDIRNERDLDVVRSLTTLKTVNLKPAAEFWAEWAGKSFPKHEGAYHVFGLKFDGPNSYVETARAKTPLAEPWTVEGWFTPTAVTTSSLMRLGPIGVGVSNFGPNGLRYSANCPGVKPIQSDVRAANGRVHLAVVHDGKTVQFFVDGEPQGEPRPVSLTGGDAPFSAGPSIYAGTGEKPAYIGFMHITRLSKAVRYSAPFTPTTWWLPDADTVALYHCFEDTGTVLKDRSASGFHGTITGAHWAGNASTKTARDVLSLTDLFTNEDRVAMPGFSGKNEWAVTSPGVLTYTSDGKPGKVMLPVSLSGAAKYSIDAEVRRLGAAPAPFSLDLFSKGKMVSIGFLIGNRVELTSAKPVQVIGNWPADSPGAGPFSAELLVHHRPTYDEIQVRINNKFVAAWEGRIADIGRPIEYHPRWPGEQLPSLFCFQSTYEFRNLRLKVYEGDAKRLK